MSAVDDVTAPLEQAASKPLSKGLLNRSIFKWGIGVLVTILAIFLARDYLRSGKDPEATAAAVQEDLPKDSGGDSSPVEITKIAEKQEQLADKQKDAAQRSQDAEGEVMPNLRDSVGGMDDSGSRSGQSGAPSGAAGRREAAGGQRASGEGHPVADGGGAAAAQFDPAAVERASAINTSALIALDGGGDKGAAGSVAGLLRSVTGGGTSTADGLDGYSAETKKAIEAAKSAQTAAMGEPAELLKAALTANQKPATSGHRSSTDVAWMKNFSEESTNNSDTVPVTRAQKLPSKNILLEGTRIPVVSLGAVNSDLPGSIRARSLVDVRDSLTQRRVLLPAGTIFMGRYSSEIKPGQTRALFAFSRMVLPDGRSVNLKSATGVDNIGRAGITGDVDNHFLQMFGYSLAIGWIGDRADASSTTTSGSSTTTTTSLLYDTLNDVSKAILQRNTSIPPTLTVDPGERFFVSISGDVLLDPTSTK